VKQCILRLPCKQLKLLGNQCFEVMKTELVEEEIIKYFIHFEILVPFYLLQGSVVHTFLLFLFLLFFKKKCAQHAVHFVLIRSSQESEEHVSADKLKWCHPLVKVIV
jgi:hypothetical protein